MIYYGKSEITQTKQKVIGNKTTKGIKRNLKKMFQFIQKKADKMKKRIKNKWNKEKTNCKMTDLNLILSKVT